MNTPETTAPIVNTYVPTAEEEWTRDMNVLGFTLFLLGAKNISSHMAALFPKIGSAAFLGEFLFIILTFFVLATIATARNKNNQHQVSWMFRYSWPYVTGIAVMMANMAILFFIK